MKKLHPILLKPPSFYITIILFTDLPSKFNLSLCNVKFFIQFHKHPVMMNMRITEQNEIRCCVCVEVEAVFPSVKHLFPWAIKTAEEPGSILTDIICERLNPVWELVKRTEK